MGAGGWDGVIGGSRFSSGARVNRAMQRMHVDRSWARRGRRSARNWGRKIWSLVRSVRKVCFIKRDVARDKNATGGEVQAAIALV